LIDNQASMQTPPPIPNNRSPDFVSRHWKLMVAGACLLALVFLAGICSFVVLVEKMMKSSSVYSGALTRAESSSAATMALGTPLKDGFFVSGNISEGSSSGTARFMIPINGPKGSGHLSVYATQSRGEWQYDDLTLLVDKTGERIDLLNTNQ
jgi:hypothetical protein